MGLIWSVMAWALTGFELLVVAWALLWDRAGWRGRAALRRRRSWYDLTGVVGVGGEAEAEAEADGEKEKRPTGSRPHGVVCPECGKGRRSRRVYTGELEFELRGCTIEELRQFVVNAVVPEHSMP